METTSTPARVFIGSSSGARKPREYLQSQLQRMGIDAEPWDQSPIFVPSKTAWECLVDSVEEFDFGVFILTPDDRTARRDSTAFEPRDNVTLEVGLFTGALGRGRVFLLVPQGGKPVALPSDLHGITYVPYSHDRLKRIGEPALGPAANKIADVIAQAKKPPLRSLFEGHLTPASIEQVFRTTAISHAFPMREDAREYIFEDIGAARESIRFYSRVYFSEVVKNTDRFCAAVQRAVAAAPDTLSITHTGTSLRTAGTIEALFRTEDPAATRWKTLNLYRAHFEAAERMIRNQRDALHAALRSDKSRAKVRFEIRAVDFIQPHCMLIIDRSVVYASFYRMSASKYGTHAPTVRMLNEEGKRDWADAFLAEADSIDSMLSSSVKRYRAF